MVIISPRSLLVEVGAQNNTVAEAKCYGTAGRYPVCGAFGKITCCTFLAVYAILIPVKKQENVSAYRSE